MKVPVERASRASLCISTNVINKWGYSLKAVLRKACKRFPEYFAPVEGDYLPKEVTSLGRWMFGIPGYKGHLVFEGGEKYIKVFIPRGCPQEAILYIRKALEK